MPVYTVICRLNKKLYLLLLSTQSVYLISAKCNSSHPLLSYSWAAKWWVQVKDCPKGDTFWTSLLNDVGKPTRSLSSSAHPNLKLVKHPAEARAETYVYLSKNCREDHCIPAGFEHGWHTVTCLPSEEVCSCQWTRSVLTRLLGIGM